MRKICALATRKFLSKEKNMSTTYTAETQKKLDGSQEKRGEFSS